MGAYVLIGPDVGRSLTTYDCRLGGHHCATWVIEDWSPCHQATKKEFLYVRMKSSLNNWCGTKFLLSILQHLIVIVGSSHLPDLMLQNVLGHPYSSSRSVVVWYLEWTIDYLIFFRNTTYLLGVKLDLTTHNITIQWLIECHISQR